MHNLCTRRPVTTSRGRPGTPVRRFGAPTTESRHIPTVQDRADGGAREHPFRAEPRGTDEAAATLSERDTVQSPEASSTAGAGSSPASAGSIASRREAGERQMVVTLEWI